MTSDKKTLEAAVVPNKKFKWLLCRLAIVNLHLVSTAKDGMSYVWVGVTCGWHKNYAECKYYVQKKWNKQIQLNSARAYFGAILKHEQFLQWSLQDTYF